MVKYYRFMASYCVLDLKYGKYRAMCEELNRKKIQQVKSADTGFRNVDKRQR